MPRAEPRESAVSDETTTVMVLDRLKVETRALHLKLEASPRMAALMADSLTVPAYIRLLEDTHRVVAPMESALTKTMERLRPLFLYESRRKVPLLERDLSYFDAVIPKSSPVPASHSETLEAALGRLYVLEGATLGGKYICGHLGRTLDLPVPEGAAYFNSYGHERGAMWARFRADLAQTVCEWNLDQDAIVESARDTFRYIDRGLNGGD